MVQIPFPQQPEWGIKPEYPISEQSSTLTTGLMFIKEVSWSLGGLPLLRSFSSLSRGRPMPLPLFVRGLCTPTSSWLGLRVKTPSSVWTDTEQVQVGSDPGKVIFWEPVVSNSLQWHRSSFSVMKYDVFAQKLQKAERSQFKNNKEVYMYIVLSTLSIPLKPQIDIP